VPKLTGTRWAVSVYWGTYMRKFSSFVIATALAGVPLVATASPADAVVYRSDLGAAARPVHHILIRCHCNAALSAT